MSRARRRTSKATEVELRRLLDALPGLVWTALPDGRAEFINQRWREYTGLALEQAIGFGWQCAIHSEDLPHVLERWRSLLESGRPGEVHARLRRHDGEYRRFLISAAPIADQSGQVVKWCGINTDIEDRLRVEEQVQADAEEALKSSEAELRQAYGYLAEAQRLSRTGSFKADMVADEHVWSDELYRILEFDSRTKISAQTIRAVLHPEDLPSFDAGFQHSVTEGIDFDKVFRIVTRSGTLKHLHCVAHIVKNSEGRPVFIGAVQDVTESKVAEEALKASEAELRRAHTYLIEAERLSKTGSFTWDVQTDEHQWSPEVYRMYGIEPGTKVTLPMIRSTIHPEDMPAAEAVIGRALEGEDFDLVFRIVASSGAVTHAHVVGHRSQEITDRPVFVGAMHDVTDSKVAEQALNKARTELAHVARVMTLGTLTASIAHEVNQPLCGIITNANTCLLMLAADPPNNDGARATAERTLIDASRAAEVIKRLRTLFAHKPPKSEPVDLNEAAREVLALSSSELQRHRVILRTYFDEGLPTVRGDRVQLQQVVLNLILNAADAMKEVGDRPRNLLVATAREDTNRVRLSVRDCGVGIDPKSLEKLFEAFYTTKVAGMGMGLSISRSIIESHEGRLWASANDGPGATFSFSIPL